MMIIREKMYAKKDEEVRGAMMRGKEMHNSA